MTDKNSSKIPVFISSTIDDLIEYRQKLINFLDTEEGFDVHCYEKFGSRDESPLETSLQEVKLCKIFIGVLGMKYGSIDEKSNKSITQLEYEKAVECKLSIRMYLIDEEKAAVPPKFVDKYEEAKKLENFKTIVKKEKTVSFFVSADHLQSQVQGDIKNILLSKDLRPDLVIPRQPTNSLTIFAAGDQSYYFGEKIKIAGKCPTNCDTIFLFLKGPNIDNNGVRLDNVQIISLSDNVESFTKVRINPDNSWNYSWDTSKLPEKCESGNYTIFALSNPLQRDRSDEKHLTQVTIKMKNPFISGIVSHSSIAQGDPIFFTGTAEGEPGFVYLWIFGNNFRLLQQQISVNRDASFMYKLTGDLTKKLSSGQYFAIIQHPMRNKIPDVITTNPGTSSNLIMINASILTAGSAVPNIMVTDLSGLDAVNSLISLLNQKNVDDSYTKMTFLIENPVIELSNNHVEKYFDIIRIFGSTNFMVNDDFLITLTQVFSENQNQKPELQSISGVTKVIKGDKGFNLWLMDFDLSLFLTDTYTLEILCINTGYKFTSEIIISDF